MNVPPPITPVMSPFAWDTGGQNQDRQALAGAVAAVNQSGLWPGRMLRVHTDLSTHSLTVQILNSQSGEVIEQIPSEVALQMAADLAKTSSLPDLPGTVA